MRTNREIAAVFIFDRNFLPVAAGLLTALLFVVAVWWMDGGFVL